MSVQRILESVRMVDASIQRAGTNVSANQDMFLVQMAESVQTIGEESVTKELSEEGKGTTPKNKKSLKNCANKKSFNK